MDLRCGPRLHGILVEGTNLIEVKCNSARCGHGGGQVVFHRFDVNTGELAQTLRFRDPRSRKDK